MNMTSYTGKWGGGKSMMTDRQGGLNNTLRHSCEVSPKQKFPMQYREWVARFPIQELDGHKHAAT